MRTREGGCGQECVVVSEAGRGGVRYVACGETFVSVSSAAKFGCWLDAG